MPLSANTCLLLFAAASTLVAGGANKGIETVTIPGLPAFNSFENAELPDLLFPAVFDIQYANAPGMSASWTKQRYEDSVKRTFTKAIASEEPQEGTITHVITTTDSAHIEASYQFLTGDPSGNAEIGYAVIQCDLSGGQTPVACTLTVAGNKEEFKANPSSRKEYKAEGIDLQTVKIEAVIV